METAIRKRPVLITTVCIIGFIWIVGSLPAVFSPSIKKLGDWYPALFGFLVAACFISYIGLWHMKRWGAHVFIGAFFLKEIILIMIDDVSYPGFVISVFFIACMTAYYKKMDVNL